MALTVENLACSRGGIAVLDGVSLAVADGAALILRGPNGIGKTTLLRTLAGLQKPDAGRIEIAEDAVAYGGHADGLKAMLSVAENLSFWAGIYGGGEIAASLDAFGLAELAGRQARDLSAGQKRRLGLARLLVTGRAVWLLDEPTVSLDRDATAMFERAVAAHLAGGGVAVIATHVPLAIAAEEMDLTPFRATARAAAPAFDEAFT